MYTYFDFDFVLYSTLICSHLIVYFICFYRNEPLKILKKNAFVW